MIILLNGTQGIGKTHLANIFEKKSNYIKMSYSQKLKDFCFNILEITHGLEDRSIIYGNKKEKARKVVEVGTKSPSSYDIIYLLNELDMLFNDILGYMPCQDTKRDIISNCKNMSLNLVSKIDLTGREMLQKFGSEIIRDQIDDSYFVKNLLNEYVDMLSDKQIDGIVIDDYRFPNEYNIPQSIGHQVFAVKVTDGSIKTDTHTSENNELYFDYEIKLNKGQKLNTQHYVDILAQVEERKITDKEAIYTNTFKVNPIKFNNTRLNNIPKIQDVLVVSDDFVQFTNRFMTDFQKYIENLEDFLTESGNIMVYDVPSVTTNFDGVSMFWVKIQCMDTGVMGSYDLIKVCSNIYGDDILIDDTNDTPIININANNLKCDIEELIQKLNHNLSNNFKHREDITLDELESALKQTVIDNSVGADIIRIKENKNPKIEYENKAKVLDFSTFKRK